jgi:hypothetical protein
MVRQCSLVLKYVYHILVLNPLHNKDYNERNSPYRAVNTLGCETDQLFLCKEIIGFVMRSIQNT